jgi:hypothetical protein
LAVRPIPLVVPPFFYLTRAFFSRYGRAVDGATDWAFPDGTAGSMIVSAQSLRSDVMDPIVIALARAAGLDKALALFPDDVRAAAEQALNNAGVVRVPTDPASEPWPPMRAGTGL